MLNQSCARIPSTAMPRDEAPRCAPRNLIAAMLTPADIVLDVDLPTKARVLEAVARQLAARHGLSDRAVLSSLVERERIGSTALGCGVAIPHARVKGLGGPVAAFVRMQVPLEFDAPDGKPVSDILVLLVPHHATEAHLLLLAEVAEMFSDASFREELRRCGDAAQVHLAFTAWRRP